MKRDWASAWSWVSQQILTAPDVETLRGLHERMTDVAVITAESIRDQHGVLRMTMHSVRGWNSSAKQSVEGVRHVLCGFELLQALNQWHDQLIHRLLELTIRDLEEEGFGAPPSPFCWLLLGSGGRREQTLHPDQDNALVYRSRLSEDSSLAERQQEQNYFGRLAERVVHRLQCIGYPFCSGYVMASNHRWNLSLVHWQEMIDSYLLLPNWDNARFLSIAADMRVAYGDEELGAELQGWFYKRVRDSRFLHWELADRSLQRAVAVSRLGAFRVDRWGENEGSIDVKHGGYLQIVDAVRVFAMAHEVTAHGTRGRIEELVRRGVWEENWAFEVQSALEVVVGYRTWGNSINPSTLSPEAAHVLKQALKTARRLQKWTAKRFPRP